MICLSNYAIQLVQFACSSIFFFPVNTFPHYLNLYSAPGFRLDMIGYIGSTDFGSHEASKMNRSKLLGLKKLQKLGFIVEISMLNGG